MRCFFFAFLFFGAQALTYSEPLDVVYKRVRNHLLIKDPDSAVAELKIHLATHPQDKTLHEMMIRSLSAAQRGVEAYKHYSYAKTLFPELKTDENLIEAFCWSILENAQYSTQYVVNVSSLIGASLTNDAKAVTILDRSLRSSSPYLRMIAVKLSAQYGDRILIEQILSLLKKEHVWFVRLEIFKTLGRLKVTKAQKPLQEILANKKSTLEEKGAAAEALLYMYDSLDKYQLESLIKSPRAGLRYFACQILAHLKKPELLTEIVSLLQDGSAEVKIAALNAFTVLGIPHDMRQKVIEHVYRLLEDPQDEVVITSARLLSFYDFPKAFEVLNAHMASSKQKTRCLSARALALTTSEGREKALDHLSIEKDPFVKINLAVSMLGFEEHETRLCEEIAVFLANNKEMLMIDASANPSLHVVLPSKVPHVPEIPHYPEAVDQKTRLFLINHLAILRYRGVEGAIKKYLKSQSFGMTFAASKALMEEGAEDSAEIIENLLEDPDEKIRIQAALILGMLGGHESAVLVLQEAYPKLDRELKMAILEALGHLGSKKSIPFLTQLLDDPFNVIKIIAASSIIQCIYH
jgi:HEAT repeat protein